MLRFLKVLLVFLIWSNSSILAIRQEYKDLDPEFVESFISGNPTLRSICLEDPECPVKTEQLKSGKCLGFEVGCEKKFSYSANRTTYTPPKPGETWNGDEKFQRENFYLRGDFGYVKERSIIHEICTAENEDQTVLQCTDNLRHCWAKNIFFDLKNLKVKTSTRYREDVIQKGQSGGNCGRFHHDVIRNNLEHLGYLQSWAHELQHFTNDPNFRVDSAHCDVIFERPTVIIKLDASVSMFHHFCDFVNLFASQMINGSFTRDIDVLWWDTDRYGFVDVFFGVTWQAFSNRKPVELISLDQKKVCFKNALLPLLARQRFGLFYNTPVVRACSGSGLFHAFSHHILKRLEIPQNGPYLDKVRITFLVRSTDFRRVLNQDELFEAMKELPNVHVKMVNYNSKMPFLEQLKITHNTDIFMSIHGSGLTHLLFLPDWAAVFEIYNCDDPQCYFDLARLRGVKYFTWQKKELIFPDGPGRHPVRPEEEHKKFANYGFDKKEFIRIVKQMIDHVRRNPKFVAEQRKLRRALKEKEMIKNEL